MDGRMMVSPWVFAQMIDGAGDDFRLAVRAGVPLATGNERSAMEGFHGCLLFDVENQKPARAGAPADGQP
jgi:hypothetical protein